MRLKENEEGEAKLRIRLAINIKSKLKTNSPTNINISRFSRPPGEDMLALPPYAARRFHKALVKVIPVANLPGG